MSRLSPSGLLGTILGSFRSWKQKVNASDLQARRRVRPYLERLEDLTLLSPVNWIGPTSGGDWSTRSNWSGGQLPGVGDDVTISGASVTHSSGSDSVHSVTEQSGAGVVLSGGTLTVAGNLTAPTGTTFTLEGGTLSGATLVSGSTLALSYYSGALSGVTVAAGATLDATQNIGYYDATANVYGGLTLNGTLDLGNAAGTTYGQLYFLGGNQTLSGSGTVVLGASTSNALYAEGNGGSSPVTLTVGSGVAVQGGSGVISGYYTTYSSDSVVLDGAITVGSGQTLTIGGVNWVNNGTITATSATVNLGGSFTVAGLGNFGDTGGTVNLTGTLNNAGTTLALAPALGAWVLHGGGIGGGTVSSTGGSTLALSTYSGALGGVTIAAGATLDATQNIGYYDATANVYGGLTLDGTLDLGNAAGTTYGQLYFLGGNQTLSGSGTVVLGASTSNALYAEGNGGSSPVTLTVGSGVAVQGGSGVISGYYTTYSSDSVILDGSITVGSGQTLTIGGVNWVNNGTITATSATVNLGGSFTVAGLGNFGDAGGTVNLTGTLNNAGTTLALAPALGAWVLHGGGIGGGTVSSTGGSTLALSTYSGALGGVTIAAGATLDATQNIGYYDATANVYGGLTLDGTLDLGNAAGTTYGQLYFLGGNQTLSGSGTVVLGASTSNALYAEGNGGNSPVTLTVGSGVAVQGGSGVISGYYTTYSSDSVVNDESINVSNGGALRLPQGLQVNGSMVVTVSANSSLTVGNNLLGTTQNPALFKPLGTVTLNGAGTSAAPQLLEAMSADQGAAAGFTNNFAYGTLVVGANNYVKLVNQSVNSPGSSAEAVYANSLIVPAGSTLNLNGLNLYVRDAQIGGTITGGSITQIPDSGPLTVNSPTAGDISVAGQLDDWTFFGRSGQSIIVALDPGSGAAGGPIAPQLQWAQVQLLDSANHVLATASSAAAGTVLTLNNIPLAADGTYTIAIKAASSHTSNVGNYVVAAWDVTPSVQSLNVNQTTTGVVATPYSTDQWTFSAAANTQVQFDLLAESASGLNFTLTGPGGFAGFTNLTGSSTLVTLPTAGTYTLTAQGTGGATGNFAFEMAQTSVTPLALGTPFSGSFAGSGQPQLFTVSVPTAAPMFLQLTDAATADHVELYARLGAAPTRQTYDYAANGAGSSQSLLIPNAAAGTWYVLAYAESVAVPPSSFTVRADSMPVFVTGITPSHAGTGGQDTIGLTGAGFDASSTVQFDGANGEIYSPLTVKVVSGQAMQVTLDLPNWTPDIYSVFVTDGGTTAKLPTAFQVTPGGKPQLAVNLILPSALGRHADGTIWVQYANTGNVAIPAPILEVDATNNALMTLDPALNGPGLATSSLPPGISNRVQFLAVGSSATPGLIQPGETFLVPIYYRGLL